MWLLDKHMHQTMLQMCAAPTCAAHHTSRPDPGISARFMHARTSTHDLMLAVVRDVWWTDKAQLAVVSGPVRCIGAPRSGTPVAS